MCESYANFEKMLGFAKVMKDANLIAATETELKKLVHRWLHVEPPLVPVKSELPEGLRTLMVRRPDFSSRYDPFVLAVEHEALLRSKVSRTAEEGLRAPFVRFYRLDQDLAPKNAEAKAAQEAKTFDFMHRLGFFEFGLIREFELCRFPFLVVSSA